ncbi:Glypican-6 [Eumeta japonica]|uniref:Glypican-6 n=1 Tax=Eumeta variegata TaxID=151549 RepID=A0A4C1THZ7_EUMVA|nr:Glypican-6 [Eumeta japonica]
MNSFTSYIAPSHHNRDRYLVLDSDSVSDPGPVLNISLSRKIAASSKGVREDKDHPWHRIAIRTATEPAIWSGSGSGNNHSYILIDGSQSGRIGVSSGCGAWWARLRWCGACAGAAVPACGRYCHNVLRACLAHHADIEQHWDAYVDAVEKVADRLLGPFNIVMVVEPIDIKISEAIMNFQEHNQEISQKIFAGCGKPVLGGSGGAGPFFAPDRTRRSARYTRSVSDFDWRPDMSDVDDFEIEASYESVLHKHPQLLQSAEDMSQMTARFAQQAEARSRFLRYMRGEIDSGELDDHERSRRDADPEPVAEPSPASSEIDFKPYEFEGARSGSRKKNNKKSNPSKNGDTSSWGGPALEGLVREARARVRNSRRYWPQLPYVLCAADTAPPTPNAPCFNGTHIASYTADRAAVGTAALASNPEVRWAGSAGVVGELDTSSQSARAMLAAVSAQQEALRALTAKLKDAYNGVEVLWRDDDDLTAASPMRDLVEVAGSGSGSGDDMDLTDDDEDNPSPYSPEGSGQGPQDGDQELDSSEEEEPDQSTGSETPSTPELNGGVRTGIEQTRTAFSPDTDTGKDTDNAEPDDSLPTIPQIHPDPPKPPAAEPAPGPTSERGVPGAAGRPSLERALFAYALPVVCAWFGTIVTDLF